MNHHHLTPDSLQSLTPPSGYMDFRVATTGATT